MTFKKPFCRCSGKLQKQNFCWPIHPFQLYSQTGKEVKKTKSLLVCVLLMLSAFQACATGLPFCHFLCNYFKLWILGGVESAGFSTLKVQTLFFHDVCVAMASLTLSLLPEHRSISQRWPKRLSEICSSSLLSQSVAFQLSLPTNDCWTLARQQ